MTDEQFNALAPFEANFKTAIDLGYSRYPGQAAIDTMFNIYRALTNTRMSLNRTCSTCILHLVQNVGRLYFKEKENRAAQELQKEEPKEEPKPNKATKKATKKSAK